MEWNGKLRKYLSLLTKQPKRYYFAVFGILPFIIAIHIYSSKNGSSFQIPTEEEPFVKSEQESINARGSAFPKIVCLVMTSPTYHRDRARHIAATWGLKNKAQDRVQAPSGYPVFYESCPDTVFVTSTWHPELKNVMYTEFSTYENIWNKVLTAFRNINASKADWFMKTDDDTFVVFPKLQNLLMKHEASKPIILGFNLVYSLRDGEQIEYMSGGAGYVLSSQAVKKLQSTDLQECQFPGITTYEDVNMGACMAALGVHFGDARDHLGRAVFLPYPAETYFDPDRIMHPDITWLNSMSKYPIKFGTQYLSDSVVSFHQIRNPVDMYLLQYFTEHLKVTKEPSLVTPFLPL